MTANQYRSATCDLRWSDDRLTRRPDWTDNLAALAVFRLLERIQNGRLCVRTTDGMAREFVGRRGEGLHAELLVRSPAAFRRLLSRGDIGFAESYVDGQWDTPDLLQVLHLAQLNDSALASGLDGGSLAKIINKVFHRLRKNSRRGSRRNIAQHYDLGNDFYASWLDPGMTYSSALFEHPEQTLIEAQTAKYRRISELAGLRPDHRVLEIGCGWGGFMEHAASHIGCTVHGVTLSKEQLAYTQQRMADKRLFRQASASLTDYRETTGKFDAVVSIEMMEAVGEDHWPIYVRTLRERLKPGASAIVQVITIADDRFEGYRRRTDFIQRHVFPGGMLPSTKILHRLASESGLMLNHEETFGESYADTLAAWRKRFWDAWPMIAAQGFDDRFRRLWQYYLCYCETGFRTGTIDVGIYRFQRSL